VSTADHGWTEVGDRVFVRRYRFFDQNIVALIGREDTRTTPSQAAEILADLRALAAPPVTVVVNTHGHSDHVFGNHVFRPCVIWGHDRCVTFIERSGRAALDAIAAQMPDLADELAQVVLDPPDRTFADRVMVEFGGRQVELRYLGRGHTDNDIVLIATDADVVCAGDLLENGATPFFGDGFPMDWPATAEALLGVIGVQTVVVPGHGDHAGRDFAANSAVSFAQLANLARRVHAGELDVQAALAEAPYPSEAAAEPLARALAQLNGEVG